MGQVTIEGTAMAAAGLSRGEQFTGEATAHIRNLVKIGAAVVVDGSLNGPADPEPADAPDSDDDQDDDGDGQGDGPDDDGAPAKNASTKVWRAWVADKVPGVTADDVADKGRDELIAAWTRYTQQVAGGS